MVSDRVRVTTRHTLNCANEAIVAALDSPFSLGAIDITTSAFSVIEVIFVYRKPASLPQDAFLSVERLKEAVSHLLDYYPHLTGRLQGNPISRATEISRLGTGAELWEAQCSRKLRHIASSSLSRRLLMQKLPGSGNSLLPIFHFSLGAVPYNPIFAIQHTRFACGGVGLGIRLHHMVCDATGFLQLVRDLAEIYRQLRDSSPPTLVFPPEIRSHFRDQKNMSPKSKRKVLKFRPPDFYLNENSTEEPASLVEDRPKVSGRVLRFSSDDLIELKKTATDPDPKSQSWVSTFEALSAYLLQKIYQARIEALDDHSVSSDREWQKAHRGFWAAIDMRDPTRLKLPARYFPNASYCASFSPSHRILNKGALWQVAKAIHLIIRSVDPDEINQQFQWIAAQPDKSHIRYKNPFCEGNFAISQWTRSNPYIGVDFDVCEDGKPITPALVARAFSESYMVDGMAVVMATEEQVGRNKRKGGSPCAIDVNLTLDDSLWPILDMDPQFRKLYG
ncbi:Transferase [Penicillium paradoxum]|uniref:Transferase n=1 Tax=Penicillium paradoxum TaxID=176176 RepID=UPI002547EA61|nr:Transferase [Penicillium paradoxum]KAJ5780214.1 Transferase [Penicillium paradoxum]